MKFRAATLVLASAGILFAATACSSGSGGGASSAAPAASKTSAPAASKTYTAGDLTTILTAAEKKLGVSGTVLDDAQVKAKLKAAGGAGGVSSLLNSSGVTYSPASCGQTVKDALDQTPPADAVNSILTYGTSTVTVTTLAGKKLPTSISSGGEAKVDDLLKSCSSMKITVTQSGQSVSIPLTIKKVDATTDADKTIGLQEVVTVPSATGGAGKAITVDVVSAVAGNLSISAQSTSGSLTGASTATGAAAPSATDVINAVVAAAK